MFISMHAPPLINDNSNSRYALMVAILFNGKLFFFFPAAFIDSCKAFYHHSHILHSICMKDCLDIIGIPRMLKASSSGLNPPPVTISPQTVARLVVQNWLPLVAVIFVDVMKDISWSQPCSAFPA